MASFLYRINIGGRPPWRRYGARRLSLTERASASGFLDDKDLRRDDMGMAASGRCSDPIPFSDEWAGRVGGGALLSLRCAKRRFQVWAVQGFKLRPCDDLRRNLTNICTAILTLSRYPPGASDRRFLRPSPEVTRTGLC